MRFTFLLSILAVALLGDVATAQTRRPFLPRRQPAAPPVVVAPAPQPAEGLFDGSVRKKILLTIVRSRTIDQMTRDGFKSVGGKVAPLSKADAESLYDRLTDDVLTAAVKEASPNAVQAIGGGGFLAGLIEWIKTHPEEVAAIVKFLLGLLALF